jgi:hypothetical protein
MPKYYLVNEHDGNEQIELEAEYERDALFEALEALGWYLVEEDIV